ncbi:MAG: hypothetical protein VB034_08120 [Eubacteriales bacterium]|nr:hypothetical protein [Eubacteriales bacterium]
MRATFSDDSRASFLLLPLLILGGFSYHLLFEAKSQYALLYYVMMFPYAAFGLARAKDAIERLPAALKNRGTPVTSNPE